MVVVAKAVTTTQAMIVMTEILAENENLLVNNRSKRNLDFLSSQLQNDDVTLHKINHLLSNTETRKPNFASDGPPLTTSANMGRIVNSSTFPNHSMMWVIITFNCFSIMRAKNQRSNGDQVTSQTHQPIIPIIPRIQTRGNHPRTHQKSRPQQTVCKNAREHLVRYYTQPPLK